jgi:hypothetical protein
LRLVFLFFYSGAVRGLLISRSQQAIYRIVQNGCGYKTTPSDFHYVISGLNGEPKSASFFAFYVGKSKLMTRFEKNSLTLTRDIIAQK